jgi:hypothetical protein
MMSQRTVFVFLPLSCFSSGIYLSSILKTCSAQHKQKHNLANHGMLPDQDDMRELLVYVTLLFIVLSWMLREVHLAFFTQEPEIREMRRSTRGPPPH